MSHFLRSGNTFKVASEGSLDIHTRLPLGTYVIKVDPYNNLYLELIDSLAIPKKIYGDTSKTATRMINTFMDRPKSTGILLNGEKGSGKTLLATLLSVKCAELDIPTIVINSPFVGDSFNQLLQAIDHPCVVMFDEFEKVYDREQQEGILTLLDGVFPSKKLFIFTCNDKYRIDEHMRNRPGRIFYMMDFKGLEENFIVEYCNDNLKNVKHIKDICNIALMFTEFNFDMLKALVEEINRYDETPQEALKLLNAKPEYSQDQTYTATLKINNKVVERLYNDNNEWEGNPISNRNIQISFWRNEEQPKNNTSDPNTCVPVNSKSKTSDGYWYDITFSPDSLISYNKQTNSFVFSCEDDEDVYVLELSKVKFSTFNYLSAF